MLGRGTALRGALGFGITSFGTETLGSGGLGSSGSGLGKATGADGKVSVLTSAAAGFTKVLSEENIPKSSALAAPRSPVPRRCGISSKYSIAPPTLTAATPQSSSFKMMFISYFELQNPSLCRHCEGGARSNPGHTALFLDCFPPRFARG